MHQTYQLSPVGALILQYEQKERAQNETARQAVRRAHFPKRGRLLRAEMVNEREALEDLRRAKYGEIDAADSDASTCSECHNAIADCTCLPDSEDRIDIGSCRHCDKNLSACECYAVLGDGSPEFGYGRVLYLAPIEDFIRDLVFCTDPDEFADDVAEINFLFGTDYDVDSIKLHPAFWEGNDVAAQDFDDSYVFIDDGFIETDAYEFADSELESGDDDDVPHDAFMNSIFGDEDGFWPRPQVPGRWVVLTGGRRKRVKSHVGSNTGVWLHPNVQERVKLVGGRRGFPVVHTNEKTNPAQEEVVVRRYHRHDLVEMSRRQAAAYDLARDAVKRAERNTAAQSRSGSSNFDFARKTAVYGKSDTGRSRMELLGTIVHVGRRKTRFDEATPEEQKRDRRRNGLHVYH